MDQLPRLGKRELICMLLFTCNYVVSVWRGFLFLWVLGMGYVILLWHSLSLPYNYFTKFDLVIKKVKVTPGSSFEQTMMGWSPRCYLPSLVEIGPPVPEKIFEGFLPYMGMAWWPSWSLWRPSWSCEPHAVNKILFPLPKEAPYKIWL